ncbi:MAG TPA: AraC family transcriptional regulator [Noviherbaspirillum sp.]|jgi:AraC-like DNA-binding protein|uniref:AraC family transcriptional regulator n=1 Tax=Noviherbaspirillum sp. TaxID=1926288 RepID=UPI002F92F8F1
MNSRGKQTTRLAEFSIRPSQLPGAELVEASTRRRFPRHIHREFGIGLMLDGGHRSWSGSGNVEAGPGDIITVNPGEVHDGAPVGDAVRRWRMLYFSPELVASAAADISAGRGGGYAFRLPVMQAPHLAGCLRRLFMAASDGAGASPLLRETLLLDLLALAGSQTPPLPVTAPPAAIVHARQRIDDDPASVLTLADLAREAGLSRFQLVRAFSRFTGLTPHAYLLQRRIQQARVLIAAGTPLAEAALASGFADQSHMTRLFARTYGIAPGAYAAALA